MEELSQPGVQADTRKFKTTNEITGMKQMYKQQTSEPHNKFPIPMSSLAIYS